MDGHAITEDGTHRHKLRSCIQQVTCRLRSDANATNWSFYYVNYRDSVRVYSFREIRTMQMEAELTESAALVHDLSQIAVATLHN